MKKIIIFIMLTMATFMVSADRGMLRGMLTSIEPIDWMVKIDKHLKYKIVSIDHDIPVDEIWLELANRYGFSITKDYDKRHVLIRKSLSGSFVELNKDKYEKEKADRVMSKKESIANKLQEDNNAILLAAQEKNHVIAKSKLVNDANAKVGVAKAKNESLKDKMFAMQEDFYDKESVLQAKVLRQKKVASDAVKVAGEEIKTALDKVAELSDDNAKKDNMLRNTKDKLSELERDNAIKDKKLNKLMAERGRAKINILTHSDDNDSVGVVNIFGDRLSGIGDGLKSFFSDISVAAIKADERQKKIDAELLAAEAKAKAEEEAKLRKAKVQRIKEAKKKSEESKTTEFSVDALEIIRGEIKSSEREQAKMISMVANGTDKAIKSLDGIVARLSVMAEEVNFIRSSTEKTNDYSDKVRLKKILNKIKAINKEVSTISKNNAAGTTKLTKEISESTDSIRNDVGRLTEIVKSTMSEISDVTLENSKVLNEINSSTTSLDKSVKSLRAKMDSMYYDIFNISTSFNSYQTQTKRGLQDISRETKTQSQSIKNLLNMTSAGLYQGRTSEEKIKRLLNNLFDIDSVDSINIGNKYDKETGERLLAIHIDKMYLKSGEVNNNNIISNKDIVFKFSPEGLISIDGIKDSQTLRYVVNKWYHEEYKDFENNDNEYDLTSRRDSEVLIFEKQSKYMPKEHEISDRSPILYETHCYSCHESEYRDAVPMKDERWGSIIQAKGISNLYKNVVNGMDYMPKKGSCDGCTEQEILSLIKYMAIE